MVDNMFAASKRAQALPILSGQERQLLDWLAAGRTNAQIGCCAGRSEKTIRNQLTRVYAKLGVVNRSEAVAVYLRMQFQAERELVGTGGG